AGGPQHDVATCTELIDHRIRDCNRQVLVLRTRGEQLEGQHCHRAFSSGRNDDGSPKLRRPPEAVQCGVCLARSLVTTVRTLLQQPVNDSRELGPRFVVIRGQWWRRSLENLLYDLVNRRAQKWMST